MSLSGFVGFPGFFGPSRTRYVGFFRVLSGVSWVLPVFGASSKLNRKQSVCLPKKRMGGIRNGKGP